MPEDMSRRAVLRGGTLAAGAAAAGAWWLGAGAQAAHAGQAAALAPRTSVGARVGATVTANAYAKGTSWPTAMAEFNHDVGRGFEVAKRYFGGPDTWPTAGKLGNQIQSLVDRKCRGLLCFEPSLKGTDLRPLLASLKAVKKALDEAGITGSKITLYQEQGRGRPRPLSEHQFKNVYRYYQEVREYFPLFVDFAGSAPGTWAAFRPSGVDGIAVDYYARTWAEQGGAGADPLAPLVQWADEAGQELGIWELGNVAASPQLPTPDEVRGYFGYLTSLQVGRLRSGHLVGDMAWYNGPHKGDYNNTISGTRLTPLYQLDRRLLGEFFDNFNGVA